MVYFNGIKPEVEALREFCVQYTRNELFLHLFAF